MSDYEVRFTLTPNRPFYEVTVNDGGPDGGSYSVISITTDTLGGNLSATNFDDAVQAFVTSMASIPNFTVTSVQTVSLNKTSV